MNTWKATFQTKAPLQRDVIQDMKTGPQRDLISTIL